MTDSPTIAALPSGRVGRFPRGSSLRTALRSLGISIESICAENATCGKCKVVVEEGDFEQFGVHSSGEHLSLPQPSERDYLSTRRATWIERGWGPDAVRLACQARVLGDVVVTVPDDSLSTRQLVRKSAGERTIEIKPSLRKYLVEMGAPSLTSPKSDWDRLAGGIATSMALVRSGEADVPGSRELAIDRACLAELPFVLRDANWRVTVTVHRDHEVVRVEPGLKESLIGAAIDVGTTTVALYLTDLSDGTVLAVEADANPQIAFGEDVMSRIAHATRESSGRRDLHKSIIKQTNALLVKAVASAGISTDDVLELVMVGNTTMQHLFLDLPPNFLGSAPFVPATARAMDVKARDLGLAMNKSANVHVLPSIASFVGADTTGMLLAEAPQEQDEIWLLIDIGTNAELVLGNRHKLWCASTPTGPAFEGAQIEHGMRAAPGAIEHIRLDPVSLEAHWKVIGEDDWDKGAPQGLCGSAVVDAVAELVRVGMIDSSGRFTDRRSSTGQIRNGSGGPEFLIASASAPSTRGDICLTQKDVRQIQLAKAALFVAAQTLLEKMGLTAPERLLLAGAFGSYIDKANAMAIGMLPRMGLDRVHVVGNAAGDGARIALLNLDKRNSAQPLAERVERHELPADPSFQDRYLKALRFPVEGN